MQHYDSPQIRSPQVRKAVMARLTRFARLVGPWLPRWPLAIRGLGSDPDSLRSPDGQTWTETSRLMAVRRKFVDRFCPQAPAATLAAESDRPMRHALAPRH